MNAFNDIFVVFEWHRFFSTYEKIWKPELHFKICYPLCTTYSTIRRLSLMHSTKKTIMIQDWKTFENEVSRTFFRLRKAFLSSEKSFFEVINFWSPKIYFGDLALSLGSSIRSTTVVPGLLIIPSKKHTVRKIKDAHEIQ